jgi:hypothetical protein
VLQAERRSRNAQAIFAAAQVASSAEWNAERQENTHGQGPFH